MKPLLIMAGLALGMTAAGMTAAGTATPSRGNTAQEQGAAMQDFMSEARGEHKTPESWWAHKAQLRQRLAPEVLGTLLASPGDPTVRESSVPYLSLELSSLPQRPPEYGPVEGFQDAFEARRDERFLDDPDPRHGDFSRRMTWLYPPQGCYARALLMGQGLEAMGLERPLTLFIFPLNPGEWLHLETPWSSTGFVEWGFHVVPVVLSDGALTVLDPAIDPSGPMPIEDWILTMLPSVADARVAICGEYALLPDSSCWSSPASNDARVYYDEQPLMIKEWNLLERLGYSPEALLGDTPPW